MFFEEEIDTLLSVILVIIGLAFLRLAYIAFRRAVTSSTDLQNSWLFASFGLVFGGLTCFGGAIALIIHL